MSFSIKRMVACLIFVTAATILASCAAPAQRTTRASGASTTPRPASLKLSADEEEVMKGTSSQTAAESKRATDDRMQRWNVTADKVRAVADIVGRAAAANGISEDLIYGIIWVESRFNPNAVSPVGAQGLMQLMPKTAAYLAGLINWPGAFDSFDPEFNIAAGAYYIARLIKQFDGDLDLALAAYNAGPTNIRRWMKNTGLPPVSIEYYTMVQTARPYFRGEANSATEPLAPGTGGTTAVAANASVPSNDALDRLGLAILISGFSSTAVGLDRPDDASPFN